MRERDLLALEFDKVLTLLANCALSSAGREACLALRPQGTVQEVEAQSERTWQFFRLLEEQLTLPLRRFPDIRSALQWAVHEGAALEGQKLLEILDVVALSRTLSTFFRRQTSGYGRLKDLQVRLPSLPALEDTLHRCLDDGGRLTDEASPELYALRRRVRSLREEIEQRLQRLLYAPQSQGIIADHYLTIRDDRFVVPVRTNFHTHMQGIVQDRSGSGETLFVEPLFAVELNNRLLLTRKEEEAEERRVFLWLTELVREELPDLERAFAALTDVDVLHAKVQLARKQQASKPHFAGAEMREVRLQAARHPLLVAAGTPVVPIDLLIPAGKSGLIVSGPNTGGKTAALKTLGLLCLMAQSGLLIPVEEESGLPVFAGVFADIGDAQSLEQNLSTFSAHVRNIGEILRELRAPALILFDEPGGGTDPLEGGALACGLLATLKARGVCVAVSTHLTAVKLFALDEGDYQIAAVGFDVDTLTPHYQLLYDAVGQSLGVAMARRLGLPEEVCASAEVTLSQDERQLARVLAQLEETRTVLRQEREQAAADREEAATLRRRHQAALTELEEKKKGLWQDEVAEARQWLRRLREEGREAVAAVQKQLREAPSDYPRARQELAQFFHTQEAALATRVRAVAAPLGDDSTPVRVGDEVEVRGGKIRGELVSLHGERARLRHGSLTFEVAVRQLRKIARAQERSMQRAQVTQVTIDRGELKVSEVNLLGLHVAEALSRLDEFLDRAVVSHYSSVRVVHGMGTGALRRAVREFLADSPYCASYGEAPQAEGGGGVTIVELTS